jgi:tetratricopeptide (TPR) repeat protein
LQSSEKVQARSVAAQTAKVSSAADGLAESLAKVEKRLAALDESVKALQPRLAALEESGKAVPQGVPGATASKLAALEASMKSLQQAMTGVSLEKASAERQALFAAEEGYLKADEYAAAGQHAVAGEGYLTFLQNHPDHADARDVMKKARDSFLKAGYKDKAFWVHEEMMKTFPQHQSADLWEQANLEKEAGLYDQAVNHAAQAAELAANPRIVYGAACIGLGTCSCGMALLQGSLHSSKCSRKSPPRG